MSRTAERLRKVAWIVGASLVIAGCTQSRLHVSDDFGRAVRQEQAAQVADPEARYVGTPPPGSNGARVGIAQDRYQHNAVIPPATLTTSTVSGGGGGGGGGSPSS